MSTVRIPGSLTNQIAKPLIHSWRSRDRRSLTNHRHNSRLSATIPFLRNTAPKTHAEIVQVKSACRGERDPTQTDRARFGCPAPHIIRGEMRHCHRQIAAVARYTLATSPVSARYSTPLRDRPISPVDSIRLVLFVIVPVDRNGGTVDHHQN